MIWIIPVRPAGTISTADLLISFSSAQEERDIVYIYLVIGIYRAIEVNTVSTQIDVVKCHHFTIYGFQF